MNKWPFVPYSKVKAYLYNLEGNEQPPILDDSQWSHKQRKIARKNKQIPGCLHFSVINAEGTVLSEEQIQSLMKAVTDNYDPHSVATCYYPRHAFLFLDNLEKPVGFIEICLQCFGYRHGPQGLIHPFDIRAIAALLQELGLLRLEEI